MKKTRRKPQEGDEGKVGIEEAALTNIHMDKEAVERSRKLYEKLRAVLIAENPTYREAKVAIQKLDNDLRIETGAYISKKQVNDICTK